MNWGHAASMKQLLAIGVPEQACKQAIHWQLPTCMQRLSREAPLAGGTCRLLSITVLHTVQIPCRPAWPQLCAAAALALLQLLPTCATFGWSMRERVSTKRLTVYTHSHSGSSRSTCSQHRTQCCPVDAC